MRIFILTAVPFPFGMASTNRIICYAKALLQQKVNCRVICFRRTENSSNKIRSGTFEGIPFKYVGSKSIRPKNIYIGKMLDLLDHLKLIIRILVYLKPGDVIFSYGSTLHYGNMLIWATHAKNGFFVRDLVEIPNISLQNTKLIVKARNRELEKQFPKYDGVIAISTALMNLSQKYVSKNCKLLKIPILVEYDKFNLEDDSEKQETQYIFHSGTLTEQKDGLLGMIKAFSEASKIVTHPIRFISTGNIENSPHKSDIVKLIDDCDLKGKIEFTGYLTTEQLQSYLKSASLVIINKYPTEQNEYCFSTKLGEYMAAGKPIIITRIGEAMNWLNDGVDSIIVEPENQKQLIDSIVAVMSNHKLRRLMSNNARITCEKNFGHHNYGKILFDYFNSFSYDIQ